MNVSGQWATLSDVGHRATRGYICLESCAPRCNRDQMCALAPRPLGWTLPTPCTTLACPAGVCVRSSLSPLARSLACVGSAQRAHRCQSAPAPCSGRSLLLLLLVVVCALWRLTAGIFFGRGVEIHAVTFKTRLVFLTFFFCRGGQSVNQSVAAIGGRGERRREK